MDDSRFDRLTRLAATTSRRATLRAAAVTALTVVGLHRGASPAAACKKVGHRCDRNGDCCANMTCHSKKCRCRRGFENCDNRCVDLDRDERHCGACDTGCSPNLRCCGGRCSFVTDTNPEFCGSCDNQCNSAQGCRDGRCIATPISHGCPAGASSCLANEDIPCPLDGDCRCQINLSAKTVCVVDELPNEICGCDSDAFCRIVLGPTGICVHGDGAFCCGAGQPNMCRLPCPSIR